MHEAYMKKKTMITRQDAVCAETSAPLLKLGNILNMKSQKEKKLKFFIPAVFAILISLIVIFSIEGIIKVYKLKAAKSKLADNLIYLKKDNAKIRRQIYDLKHNKQYISELARQELGMIKRGEIVFKFFSADKSKNVTKRNKSNASP